MRDFVRLLWGISDESWLVGYLPEILGEFPSKIIDWKNSTKSHEKTICFSNRCSSLWTPYEILNPSGILDGFSTDFVVVIELF